LIRHVDGEILSAMLIYDPIGTSFKGYINYFACDSHESKITINKANSKISVEIDLPEKE
jgi:hypothetical protein